MFPALERLLDRHQGDLKAAIHHLNERLTTMAKTLDDILAAQSATLAKMTAMKTVDDSIAALVTSQKQTLTDLKGQLDAAIASNDPTKLQQVADNMDAINAQLDAQAATEAAVANTPAA